jgi:hypothetical protein
MAGRRHAPLLGVNRNPAVITCCRTIEALARPSSGPSVSLSSSSDIVDQLSQLVSVFQMIVGLFPAFFLNRPVQEVLRTLCTASAENMSGHLSAHL